MLAAPMFAGGPGTMNEAERAFLIEQLELSKKNMLASIAGLTEAQWRFKPAPNVWSVAECAEHIILSEDFLFNTAADAAQEFTKRRDRSLAYVRSTDDDLRVHATKGPLGTMDTYQFLLLMAVHAGRHTAQIREVQL